MTLVEKNAADNAKSNVKALSEFSKSFRSSQLNNLNDGEEFVIPENYEVKGRIIGDNVAEYINVQTNTGRVVEFYPSAVCRPAFECDADGKNVMIGNRRSVKYPKGDVYDFCEGKEINSTMQAMKGCKVHYHIAERVKTRAFGVDEALATAKDVQETIIGEWTFVGSKKPQGYVAKK